MRYSLDGPILNPRALGLALGMGFLANTRPLLLTAHRIVGASFHAPGLMVAYWGFEYAGF